MICPVCHTEQETTQGRFTVHGDCPGGFARTDLADTNLESRYSDPRPDCPHPERWHSDDWDSAEHEITGLIAALVRALRPDVVVETGSAFGQTSYAIGSVLQAAGVGTLHAIEIDPERADITRKRCEGQPVVVEQMSSMDYQPPEGIGFAFFDSLVHLRVPEFRRFYPSFSPGALVGFHDTGPHVPGLRGQIEELEQAGFLLPIFLPTPRGFVLGEVNNQ